MDQSIDVISLYYLITKDNKNIRLTNKELEEIANISKQRIEDIKILDLSGFLEIYYASEFLKDINNVSLNKQHIKELFEEFTDNSSNPDVILLQNALKLKIYKNLGLQIHKEEKQELSEISNRVNEGKVNDLFLLYYLMEVMNTYGKDFDVHSIKTHILEFQNENGTFRMSKNSDSVTSYISTFFALHCLKMLQN